MNFYKRYPGDYGRDTAHLSLTEHGVYTLLLDHYYGTELPLPAAYTDLERICRAYGRQEKTAVRRVADAYFPLHDDGLRHNGRCDRQLPQEQRGRDIARQNGKLGGRPRQTARELPVPGLLEGVYLPETYRDTSSFGDGIAPPTPYPIPPNTLVSSDDDDHGDYTIEGKTPPMAAMPDAETSVGYAPQSLLNVNAYARHSPRSAAPEQSPKPGATAGKRNESPLAKARLERLRAAAEGGLAALDSLDAPAGDAATAAQLETAVEMLASPAASGAVASGAVASGAELASPVPRPQPAAPAIDKHTAPSGRTALAQSQTAATGLVSTRPNNESPADRPGQIAALMRLAESTRRRSLCIASTDPRVVAWAKDGVTDAQLYEALELARAERRARDDPTPLNAGFIDIFVTKLRRPKPAGKKPWFTSWKGIEEMAYALHIERGVDEHPPAFKARVLAKAGVTFAQVRRAAIDFPQK